MGIRQDKYQKQGPKKRWYASFIHLSFLNLLAFDVKANCSYYSYSQLLFNNAQNTFLQILKKLNETENKDK